MKLPGRRLSILTACLLLIAVAFAASVRSIFRPPVNSARTTTSSVGSNNSIKPQAPQQGVTPQAIGPIDHYVFAGGGGTSTGGNLSVTGTVGEVSASNTQTGGSFSLNGGFWNAVSGTTVATSTPTPTPTPGASPTPTPSFPANVVQFNSSIYSVQEDCTTLTITVTRTGDTSGAASVGYNTSDITATERKDYITALGRLQFAPGEISKSFVVLINEDSFVEGNESFNVNLSNPVGATFGSPAIATVTIIDDPSEPATNAIDDPRTFVCQHYHDFLNRQPDQSGWDFWTNQIASCGTDQACIDVKRINVSGSFFLSIEFQQTGYLVERMYKVAYGDSNGTSTFGGSHPLPVPQVRFRDFLSDTQEIGLGVVVLQPGWEQQLENNKQAFALEFVQRPNFTATLPTTLTPNQFVDTLNANAGNVLSADERQSVINLFNGAADTSNQTARAQALRQVAEDSDLFNSETNRAFVLMQYFGYLRRNPNDPNDTDYTGYDFWLTKLNQFHGNYIDAEMVKAFIASGEYRTRFGQN
jgi:hypothetical protein